MTPLHTGRSFQQENMFGIRSVFTSEGQTALNKLTFGCSGQSYGITRAGQVDTDKKKLFQNFAQTNL